jgi:hypothetical protein
MPTFRARRVTWTLNNYSDDEITQLEAAIENPDVTYICWGREVGETGTPHLQGYAEFAKRMGRRTILGILCRRMAIFKSRGSAADNRDYCRKDGDFVEFGEIKRQGRRTDLEAIREEIDAGATERDIANTHFSQWVIYRRSFSAYRELQARPRDFKTCVVVWAGITGCGKTRAAHEFAARVGCDEPYVWGGDRWFDGYNGQSVAIFDDFDSSCVKAIGRSILLQLLDRYALRVPIKGGFVNWRPRWILITSNFDIDVWVEEDERTAAPLLRRIDAWFDWNPREREFFERRYRRGTARRLASPERSESRERSRSTSAEPRDDA